MLSIAPCGAASSPELAAYVSSEPGPGGKPLYEWIDVREVMWERPRTTDAV